MKPIATGYPGTYWWGVIEEGRREAGEPVRHRIFVSTTTADLPKLMLFQVVMAGAILQADILWPGLDVPYWQFSQSIWWEMLGFLGLLWVKIIACISILVMLWRVVEAEHRLTGLGKLLSTVTGAAIVGLLVWGGWVIYPYVTQTDSIQAIPWFGWVESVAAAVFVICVFMTFPDSPLCTDVRSGDPEADPIREALEAAETATTYSERIEVLERLQNAVRRYNHPRPKRPNAEVAERRAAIARASAEALRKRQLADGPL